MECHEPSEVLNCAKSSESCKNLKSKHESETFNEEAVEVKVSANVESNGHKEQDGYMAETKDSSDGKTGGPSDDVARIASGSKSFLMEEGDVIASMNNFGISENVAESICLQSNGTEERVKLVTSLDIECVGDEKDKHSVAENGVKNADVPVGCNTGGLDVNNSEKVNEFSMNASVHPEHIGDLWVTRNLKTFEYLPFTNIDKLMSKSGCEGSVFHDLPDELIVKIFSYLSTQELCQNVAPVCRKWRQISLDHSLWKSLDFSRRPHLSSLNLLWVMRRAPLLKRLVISGRVNITRAEVAIFTECCPGIQDIDFGFCDSLSGDMIQCLAENCSDLMKINVEGCDNLKTNCLKHLVKCKKLSHLNFSHCMFLQDSGVKFLAKGLPVIKSINLDGISFLTDSAVTGLVGHHYLYLEEVELDGAEISDAGIQQLARCTQLKHLGISFCECLTDMSLEYLKDLKNLVSLRLRKGSDFTADGLSSFFKSASLSKLHFLNLSECSAVNDLVVLDMAQACGSHLKELALSWCWFITDTGLVSLVDHCCNLEMLDLLGIDRICGECLARVPEEMTKLKFLDLRQCNQILDNLIVDMVRRKKDLKVINYYGEEFVHD